MPIDNLLKLINEKTKYYQELFNHFSKEHDLTLTVNEMDEIIKIVLDMKKKTDDLKTQKNKNHE